jgi:predicted RNA-binding Zn-ribbon protein involved in translation (DUF1610 family)
MRADRDSASKPKRGVGVTSAGLIASKETSLESDFTAWSRIVYLVFPCPICGMRCHPCDRKTSQGWGTRSFPVPDGMSPVGLELNLRNDDFFD